MNRPNQLLFSVCSLAALIGFAPMSGWSQGQTTIHLEIVPYTHVEVLQGGSTITLAPITAADMRFSMDNDVEIERETTVDLVIDTNQNVILGVDMVVPLENQASGQSVNANTVVWIEQEIPPGSGNFIILPAYANLAALRWDFSITNPGFPDGVELEVQVKRKWSTNDRAGTYSGTVNFTVVGPAS